MQTQTHHELIEGLPGRGPHIPREAVFKEDLLAPGSPSTTPPSRTPGGRGQAEVVLHLQLRPEDAARAGGGAAAPPAGGGRAHRRALSCAAPSFPCAPTPTRRTGLARRGRRTGALAGREPARGRGAAPDAGVLPARAGQRQVGDGDAPTIQWGYLIYLTVLRLCQYFGAKEECQYCDINHNWRQHKQEGRPYTGVKPVEEVLEALAIIDRYDTAGIRTPTRSPAGA